MVGVCDDHGDQACAVECIYRGSDREAFEEAKNHLKKKTGIDYTTEKRSKESEITLRLF